MPGAPLNLDLPQLADTLATTVSKIAVALDVIQRDLSGRIVPAQMNINAALSMNGSALLNVGSMQLAAGNVPSTPGSVYFSGGELWVRDTTGPVRLTLNGAIDAASVGGISGLGGTAASVVYDLSSQQFRFLADAAGAKADVAADDVLGNRVLLVGSAGNAILATNTNKDLVTASIALTNDLAVGGNVNATGSISTQASLVAAALHTSADQTLPVPLSLGRATDPGLTVSQYNGSTITLTSGAPIHFPVLLSVNSVLKGANVYVNKASGTSVGPRASLVERDQRGGAPATLGTPLINTGAAGSIVLALTIPAKTITAGKAYILIVETTSTVTNETITGVDLIYQL